MCWQLMFVLLIPIFIAAIFLFSILSFFGIINDTIFAVMILVCVILWCKTLGFYSYNNRHHGTVPGLEPCEEDNEFYHSWYYFQKHSFILIPIVIVALLPWKIGTSILLFFSTFILICFVYLIFDSYLHAKSLDFNNTADLNTTLEPFHEEGSENQYIL